MKSEIEKTLIISSKEIMYLAINNISKKWTMPVQNWGVIINQLSIMFGDRVKL